MAEPELSVVTVGVRGDGSLGPVLRALAAQTIADRLELVVVVPDDVPFTAPGGFGAVRTVRAAGFTSTGQAIAAGVHAASAGVVAYAEEHSWPREDWAEHLMAAHAGGPAAVSWTLENANPESASSWVHLLSDFGPAVHPSLSGPISTPPWHHTSYRRDVLTAYGAELGEVLEAEWRVHADVADTGQRVMHSGAARSRHWNVSRYGAHISTEFRGSRSFGASRVEHGSWSRLRRAGYASATPLIFAVRLRRTLPHVQRVDPPRRKRVSALLAMSLGVAAVGESLGYIRGSGSSRRRRMLVELDRGMGLAPADRARWEQAARHEAQTGLRASATTSSSGPSATTRP